MLFLRDIFYLRKSDRRAIGVLVLVFTALLVLAHVLGTRDAEALGDDLGTPADSLFLAGSTSPSRSSRQPAKAAPYALPMEVVERFAFDPNTADSTQFLRLGLQPWQVRNIYKYRARGGVYRKKEDFARLYGLTVKQYRELEPYIQISDDYRPASTLLTSADRPTEAPLPSTLTDDPTPPSSHPRKLAPGETVDLARADTTLLKQVPGIGPYFARRIVDYRDRLGGFYAVHQLMEIEGFPEQALDYMELGESSIRKLRVNDLTLTQLRRHPYLSFYQAKAILDYRRLYGDLKDIAQLRLSKDFTDADLARLAPYLEY